MSYAPRGRGNRSGGYQRQLYQNRPVNNNSAYLRRPYERRGPQQNYNQNYSSQNYPNYSSQNHQPGHNQYQKQYLDVQKPRNENQVWMGDLDPRWNEQAIADIWSQIGESPVSIKIMKDGREPGGGYCFVSFANANAVQTALTYNGSPIPNSSKHFKLNIASRGKNTATDIQRNSKPANDFSIFVGDLAMDVSEPILYEAFNSLFPDQVKQVKIMMDNSTRASKGFGFVRFFDANTQAKALTEANGMVVGSRAIRVGMAAGSNKPQPVTNIVHSDRLASPAIEEEVKLPKHARFSDPTNNTIVVHGLSGKVTEEELALHLSSFGEILYCTLSSDFDSGYVKFYNRQDAETAIFFMYGQIINDCRIQVSWGHGDVPSSETSKLTMAPATSKYNPPQPLPEKYGVFQQPHLIYEKSDELPLIEESEPQTVSAINEHYLSRKRGYQKILKEAQL